MLTSMFLLAGITFFPLEEQPVDLLEVHHKYNGGTRVYSQIIAWRRRPENGKYEVRSWRMADTRHEDLRPPLLVNGVWKVDMVVDNKVVVVRSGLFRETFTNLDPESMDRARLPEQFRLKLALPHRLPLPNPSESRSDGSHDSP